jgi:hypothetical protein
VGVLLIFRFDPKLKFFMEFRIATPARPVGRKFNPAFLVGVVVAGAAVTAVALALSPPLAYPFGL